MRTDHAPSACLDGFAAAAATDAGRTREHNEDRYHVDPTAGIFLVVDGVGGEAAGEVAAQIAVQTIVNRLARQDGPAEVRIREAITLANRDILRHAQDAPGRRGMACVLTLAVLEGRHLTIGHVGDSRLYKLTADGIAKLTHDHSPVGEREDAREISETEAMQHARRNEVYRDVGSEPRDPYAPDFIEIGVTTVDDGDAILLCSDGLSDMLTSLEIDRIARAHAGDPHAVVETLVAAANDAGGRDNITVIFVEGPGFARRAAAGRGRVLPPASPGAQVSTTPLTELVEARTAGAATHQARPGGPVSAPPPRRPGPIRRVLLSRAAALVVGMALGTGAMLAALHYGFYPPPATVPSRPIVVGSSGASTFQTIGDALAHAAPGDVVLVEPGEYAETLVLPAGVDLVARVAGSAVLIAPTGAAGWTAVTAYAGRGLVRGFRIEGRPNAPIAAGVRVLGGDLEIDDVTFEGSIGTAVDIGARSGAVVLRSSRFTVVGLPLRIGAGAAPLVRQNVFVAGANRRLAAIELPAPAAPRLQGNVFVHFPQAVSPPSRREVLLDDNFVIPVGARR